MTMHPNRKAFLVLLAVVVAFLFGFAIGVVVEHVNNHGELPVQSGRTF